MKILYIDSNVRKESRTAVLAGHLLKKLSGDVTTAKLCEMRLPEADEAFLEKRSAYSAAGDFSDDMFAPARQFAQADIIVIAAPFWDLSFPALLKHYFEQVTVTGLTFGCTEDGGFYGMCRAKKLYYVTTAGGRIFDESFGFGYVKALAQNFYGIEDCVMYKAEGLDILGNDPDSVLAAAMAEIDKDF